MMDTGHCDTVQYDSVRVLVLYVRYLYDIHCVIDVEDIANVQ